MRLIRLAAASAVAVLASSLLAAPAQAATPGTITNAISAMHDEALAYADYQAWAVQADTVPNHDVATLLGVIAVQERGEHFSELAAITNVVGSSFANLVTTTTDENTEATSTYPEFQAQAIADGDTTTAALFAELAIDEASHRSTAVKAYRALCCHAARPANPVADPVTILQQPAQTSGQTLINVRTAMRGEAYASARYLLFAQQAYSEGRSWVGRLFTALSAVELTEHYAALANRYGLVGTINANLTAAVAAEDGAIATYTSIATAATAAGDTDAAALFTDIGTDESAHRTLFADALAGLES